MILDQDSTIAALEDEVAALRMQLARQKEVTSAVKSEAEARLAKAREHVTLMKAAAVGERLVHEAELKALRDRLADKNAGLLPRALRVRIERWRQERRLKSDMKVIRRSGLFDAAWYAARYGDVGRSGIDPLYHYVRYGAAEGRDPNPDFDFGLVCAPIPRFPACRGQSAASLYPLRRCGGPRSEPDVQDELVRVPLSRCEGIGSQSPAAFPEVRPRPGACAGPLGRRRIARRNVLLDFLRRAIPPGRSEPDEAYAPESVRKRPALDVIEAIARMDGRPLPPAILVPIHNAAAEVDDCIAALLAHTPAECRMLLLEDASPDPAVDAVLSGYQHHAKIEIHRNAKNLGFTRTVNLGMEMAGGADVVLLNSDTKVTPRWLENLRLAAYSGDRVATATALSNNAGAFSVPEFNRENLLPGWLGSTTMRGSSPARRRASIRRSPPATASACISGAIASTRSALSTPRLSRAAMARRTISACVPGGSAGRM